MQNAKVDVRPKRFFQKFVHQDDGSVRSVDWVEYYPVGADKFTITPDAVSRLQKRTDGVWEALAPYYDAWKRGQEAPLDGTPLAAWSGVTPEQAEILKQFDVRTVENIRDLTDTQMRRIPLPNLGALKQQAQAWDAAKDSRKVEAALAQKDEEIELLKIQMADMMALLGKDNTEEPVKRKPGRPRRDEGEAEAA